MAAVTNEAKTRITARITEQMRDTLERESVIHLSHQDAKKVFELLEHPPKANKQLKEAVRSFKRSVRL